MTPMVEWTRGPQTYQAPEFWVLARALWYTRHHGFAWARAYGQALRDWEIQDQLAALCQREPRS